MGPGRPGKARRALSRPMAGLPVTRAGAGSLGRLPAKLVKLDKSPLRRQRAWPRFPVILLFFNPFPAPFYELCYGYLKTLDKVN
jgi:hypothetical protein